MLLICKYAVEVFCHRDISSRISVLRLSQCWSIKSDCQYGQANPKQTVLREDRSQTMFQISCESLEGWIQCNSHDITTFLCLGGKVDQDWSQLPVVKKVAARHCAIA